LGVVYDSIGADAAQIQLGESEFGRSAILLMSA
jgi:hypothetical protein